MNQPAFVALPPEQTIDESEPDIDIAQINDIKATYERINKSVTAVGVATYHWDIASDVIEWNGDTGFVFDQLGEEKLATGRAYAALLDPDNFTSRFETVMRNKHRDNGHGVPFSIEYSIKPLGRDEEMSIWIEDVGRWYAGPDGRPKEVFGIVRQIDDRHQRDQHLQFMGNCDPLTGLMNRGRLTEALGETIGTAESENRSSAFMLVAVNNLDVVNDSYGFDVADEVVLTIAKRLREVVRTGDVIGRYSGSKFGLILNHATREEIGVAADRFLSIARQRVIETSRGPVWAMLSIGGIILPHEKVDANGAMSLAEEALSEAMRLPSDGFVAYEPSSGVESERHLNSRCAIEIVHGLKENNFRLAYQPIVDAKTNEVVFHEALLRMKCDNGDVVAAGHLVPIAEKLGLVRLIDQTVVHKVLAALEQFPEARVAVNLSGLTINDPRWFEKISEMLEQHKGVTSRLTVEITETIALHDIDQTVRFIEKLHALGCQVAIDDFGAGFTSFRNLKDLNVDKVKIDGSFCENLSHNLDNQYFVRTLIDLAKKFDLKVVAEWVESQEDANLLTNWGADFLQGRLFGMAESESPWGAPLSDEGEQCVVPSEIDFEEPEVVPEMAMRKNATAASNAVEAADSSAIGDVMDTGGVPALEQDIDLAAVSFHRRDVVTGAGGPVTATPDAPMDQIQEGLPVFPENEKSSVQEPFVFQASQDGPVGEAADVFPLPSETILVDEEKSDIADVQEAAEQDDSAEFMRLDDHIEDQQIADNTELPDTGLSDTELPDGDVELVSDPSADEALIDETVFEPFAATTMANGGEAEAHETPVEVKEAAPYEEHGDAHSLSENIASQEEPQPMDEENCLDAELARLRDAIRQIETLADAS